MNCPHCSAPLDLDLDDDNAHECSRCGGALHRRWVSSRPAPPRSEASERREATIVFCDLGGYTRWNEEEDPEDIALVMDLIRNGATRIFEAHGGIVNQFVGDEVMAVFGLASSHEDDPCRAIAAALAFHAFLREGESFGRNRRWPLRLHSGAEAGLIYSRAHDLRGGLFEITGEAVNTAARLRALAQPDELLCGPSLQLRVQPFYQLQPLAPVRLHGTSEAIVPQRVLAARSENTWFEVAALRGLTQYVNRESQLAALLDVWRRAEDGQGSVVAVSGPPGIGKSRFLHELRVRIGASAQLLHGRCSAYRNPAPYQPFIAALQGLLPPSTAEARDPAARLAQLAGRLHLSAVAHQALGHLLTTGERTEGAGSPQAAELRAAIVAALVELLAALARERPLLILLEDWHWADETSRNALRQLAQVVGQHRALIALNYRSTELTEQAQPQVGSCIELQPLDPQHTESMASHVLGGRPLPSGLSDFVHVRTLGNPFFVEEICRALLESGTCGIQSGTLVLQQPLFQLRAPDTVQAIVRGRVDRLPLEQRALLRLAAVIGGDFDLELLGLLADDPDSELLETAAGKRPAHLLGLLLALEGQDMVHRDAHNPSLYHFKHAITREVVYESMPVRARRRQHAHLARAIEARQPPERIEASYETLAHHYQLGGERGKALEFAVLAANKAWGQFALEQAGLQYRRAFELLLDLAPSSEAARSRQIDVSLDWARVGIYNPEPELVDVLQSSFELATQLGDARRAALCLDWLGWITYGLGAHQKAVRYAEQFLEHAQRLAEPRLIAQAHINCGREYMVACDYERAVRSIELGLGIHARTNAAARSFALSNLAMIAGDRGQFPRAYAHISESESVANQQLSLLGPLWVLRAIVESWQGAWSLARDTSARAHDIGQRIEGRYILGMSLLLGGHARFIATAERSALEQTRAGIEQLEQTGRLLHMSYNWSLFASALAQAGDYAHAERAAERALTRSAQYDRQGEGEALRTLARVAGLRDRHLTRALDRLTQAACVARDKASERELALCDLSAAEILRAHGERQRAASAQASGMARAQAIGMLTAPGPAPAPALALALVNDQYNDNDDDNQTEQAR